MASKWMETLKAAQKTCIIQNGRRKIHFSLSDHTEMAEEYDMKSGDLIVRKWRRKGTLGEQKKWEMEVGQETQFRGLASDTLIENCDNPVLVRLDTKTQFQWRVRNLPYPLTNYSVSVDRERRQVVIRTANKKYYKRFSIPDMDRLNLELLEDSVSFTHANNTLIVSYVKPAEVVDMERRLQREFKRLKADQDGDVDCTPS